MTTRRTTKKTAAPPPEKDTPEPKPDLLGPFPLHKGDYFSRRVMSRHGHSGATAEEQEAIALIQQVVGAPVDPTYTNETATAVAKWREAHDLPRGDFVDKETWQALRESSSED